MNISLKKGINKKKSLGYGLNGRSTSDNNVFGDNEEESSDDEETGNARQRINRQISKEQAALRQRAQVVMASSSDGGIFDFDGAYESFHKHDDKEEKDIAAGKERKSRYIKDLLETAKKRQRDREVVNERKIAKEQALEDEQEDFAGKEKFITKAYRKKLEERTQWEAEEEDRRRSEEANDVTKQTTAGAAMATFYGNFSKNIAMGGGTMDTNEGENISIEPNDKLDIVRDHDHDEILSNRGGGMGFLSGFERAEEDPLETMTDQGGVDGASINDPIPLEKEPTVRERRDLKVAAARARYLQRKGISLQQ